MANEGSTPPKKATPNLVAEFENKAYASAILADATAHVVLISDQEKKRKNDEVIAACQVFSPAAVAFNQNVQDFSKSIQGVDLNLLSKEATASLQRTADLIVSTQDKMGGALDVCLKSLEEAPARNAPAAAPAPARGPSM
jgi:hypothetical protein